MSLRGDWWFTDEKEGWYEFSKPYNASTFFEMLEFIEENFDKPYRHCRWTLMLVEYHDNFKSVFRFRYERDYIKFVLRWS